MNLPEDQGQGSLHVDLVDNLAVLRVLGDKGQDSLMLPFALHASCQRNGDIVNAG